jgi:hypothetical protein
VCRLRTIFKCFAVFRCKQAQLNNHKNSPCFVVGARPATKIFIGRSRLRIVSRIASRRFSGSRLRPPELKEYDDHDQGRAGE